MVACTSSACFPAGVPHLARVASRDSVKVASWPMWVFNFFLLRLVMADESTVDVESKIGFGLVQ